MTIDNDELEAIGARLTDSILTSYERSSRLNYRSYRRALKLSGLADAHLTVLEAVQSTARNFATAELLYLQADPEYPMIVKMISVPGKSSGGPNPDCNYQQASLHGDHSWISGNRCSAGRSIPSAAPDAKFARRYGLRDCARRRHRSTDTGCRSPKGPACARSTTIGPTPPCW